MKHLLFFFLLCFITNPANAEEECIFDPVPQDEMLLKLQKNYVGSKVSLNEKALELPWENGTVIYKRGGCIHFGENVTYTSTSDTGILNKDDLFRQAVILTKEFFRDFVSGSEIENLLQSGKYSYEKLSVGDYYSIHNGKEYIISLGILYSQEGSKQVIEVGYYFN